MPNNWKTYKLGDLISYQKGFAFKSDWFKDKGDLVVRVSDTTNNSIDISSCHRIDEEKAKELQKYKLEKDDIVIATVGSWPPNFASVVGKVVKVPLEADGALLNQNAVRLKSIDEKIYSKKYIYYLMKSEYFLKYIVNTAQGSANQASIKLTDIFDFKFDIPFIQEQKSIASILSAIDDKIENNLAINKTLEEMAMALYKHWFVDFGPFQDGEFVESELGRIPKGWEVKRLSECNELILGGTPSRKNQSYWENGTIGWLNSGKVNEFRIIEPSEYITQEALRKSSTKVMQKGTTVLAITGATLGQISRIEKDFCANQSVIGILKSDLFSNEYIYLWIHFAMEELIKLATGGAQQHVNKNNVGDLKIVFPSLTIMNDFQNAINDVFDNISKNMFENQTLTQLRDTLLPKLISGEVRLKEFRN